MSRRFQQIAFGVLACGIAVGNLGLSPAAHAFADNYSPLSTAQLKPFALTPVGQIGGDSSLTGWPAGRGQIKVQLDGEAFQLSGQSALKS